MGKGPHFGEKHCKNSHDGKLKPLSKNWRKTALFQRFFLWRIGLNEGLS